MKTLTILFILCFSITTLGQSSLTQEIPYPFYIEHENGENQILPLERGEAALQLRIDLIREAKKSIEVEYYIFSSDTAGKILARELIKASQRGVKVRILVDKFGSSAGLNEFVAEEFARYRIPVKFYNSVSIFRFKSIHYRNHRKLMVFDNKEAIIGGRNIGDEYFNMAKKYNYEDFDVYVKGPIVKAIKDSFDAYYENKLSAFVKRPKRPVVTTNPRGGVDDSRALRRLWEKKVSRAKAFLDEESAEEKDLRPKIEAIGKNQLNKTKLYECPTMSFATDAPGAAAKEGGQENYHELYRNLSKTFSKKLMAIDKELIMSSPYFIANKNYKFMFQELLNRDVDITLYSNSLRSTDVIFMSSHLYFNLHSWLKKGIKVFFNDGHATEAPDQILDIAHKSRWGTHSKVHIYETSKYSEIMVGTYNIHNRSDHFNTELAIFCKGSEDFSRYMRNKVMGLARKGIRVESMTKAYDRNGNKVNVTGTSGISKFNMSIFSIPSMLFDHLL